MIQPQKNYQNLAVPAILAVALISLAILQIVWLKDLSEGQRERMKENVEIGATRLAEDLTDALQSTYSEFQFISTSDDSLNNIFDSVHKLWADWKNTTAYPELIDTVYVYRTASQDSQLVAITPTGEIVVTSPDNHIIKARLKQIGTATNERAQDLSSVFDDESFLIVNVIDPVVLTIDNSFMIGQDISNIDASRISAISIDKISDAKVQSMVVETKYSQPTKLILMIDREYLKNSVIPELTAKHLMYDGSLDYTVSIAKVDSNQTFTYYGDENQESDTDLADVSLPISRPRDSSFLVVRAGTNLMFRNSETQSVRIPSFENVRMSISASSLDGADQPTWNLYVRHKLGSIDVATNRFRRNSSLLSLGIVTILGVGFVLIYRNNRKASELARQQMEFVAGVSHELRTPLSVIRSAGDNMTAGLIKDEESALRYGKLIHSESIRLNDLIEQVLEFSGIQSRQRSYEFKPRAPHELIIQSLKGLGDRIDPEKVSVNLNFEPCPDIMADTAGLISVIQNLVINAVKYSLEEPKVHIRVYNKRSNGKQAVCIDVVDNGQGVSNDELDKIFEPFYRAKGVREQQIKGNGLGLSIVKSIALQHNATITVKSERGTGSTFTLTFNWLSYESNNVR